MKFFLFLIGITQIFSFTKIKTLIPKVNRLYAKENLEDNQMILIDDIKPLQLNYNQQQFDIGSIIVYTTIFYIAGNLLRNGIDNLRTTNFFGTNDDKYNIKKQNITMESWAGSPEIFEECTDIIDFFKNFELYKQAGITTPRGFLLDGPPGCGKTQLAKIIAAECNVNFIATSGSDFVEVFVGYGAKKIRDLFADARKNKPSIIFIDEIDAVGRQRGAGGTNMNQEQEQTLNQLLYEMDGFNDNDQILVIAATNRRDTLDSALIRPGRFDRLINIPPPDRDSRKRIFELYLKNKNYDETISTEILADLTTGMSGADIKNLVNEAAISMIKRNGTNINNYDILNSLDKILVGIIKKNDTRSKETKQMVAIHELGHAVITKLYNEYFTLNKVTIKNSYSGVGGFTLFTEKNNDFPTKESLKKRIIILLGGRAAEELYFGDNKISIGASMDLKQANTLAQQMITKFGFGKNLLSNERNTDITQSSIDREVISLLDECYREAKTIIQKNKIIFDELIDKLLEEETIFSKDFPTII